MFSEITPDDFRGVVTCEIEEAEKAQKRKKYPVKLVSAEGSDRVLLKVKFKRRVGFTYLESLLMPTRRIPLYFLKHNPDGTTYLLSDDDRMSFMKEGTNFMVQKYFDTSLENQLKALESFYQQENPHLSGLYNALFKKEKMPEVIPTDKKIQSLNKAQAYAVNKCAGMKEGQAYLLQGPPGTGKTTTILEMVKDALEKKEKVLVSAHTNIAIDNVFERLRGKIDLEKTIRIGNSVKTADTVRDMIPEDNLRKDFAKISESNLVGTTLAKLGFLHDWGALDWKNPMFDLVIIDEASMATLPLALLALLNGKKFVLVGDHKQLAPVVTSKQKPLFVTDFHDEARLSLFELLMGMTDGLMLSVQYRTHKGIMNFISNEFYNGKLTTHESANRLLTSTGSAFTKENSLGTPLTWIDTQNATEGKWRRYGNSFSYVNEKEAGICSKVYCDLVLNQNVPKEDIAVITPFRLQTQLIEETLRRALNEEFDVDSLNKIDARTVHAFQGRQKKIVIYNMVLDKLFFNMAERFKILADNKMLNVAISRAESKLIIIGSQAIADKTELPAIAHLLDYTKENGELHSADNIASQMPHLDKAVQESMAALN